MSKLLYSVTKEEFVKSASMLIKHFDLMQKEAYIEASEKGYYLDKQTFKPNCSWENLNKDGTEIILKYKLEIYEN